ncbi:MAG: PTS sugar transporter subunit IIA [Planctomycetota bacterium]|nr:PTS sugar transporter subunit IIA [Planctomycetota bacterium]
MRIGHDGGLPFELRLEKSHGQTIMPHSDFTIESLAAHLHLTPQQVIRLADRDKLPGRKVGGKWVFSRADIHHWFEDRIGLSDEGELVEVEGVLGRSASTGADHEIAVAELLLPEAIAVPLAARTQGSVIRGMVDMVAQTGMLWDPEKMIEAISAREKMHPTALGNGVALLHPRRPMASILGQPLVALGITPSGIPFGGGRGMLTDIFFLICSIDDRGHLQALARLSRMITASGVLDELRAAPDSPTAHRLIVEADRDLSN